jgi:hypothetical protein
MKRQSFDPSAGGWFRFDGYEIVDGLIRPRSRSAMLEYDPWAIYREQLAAKEGSAPYVSLIEAIGDVGMGEDGKPTRPLKPREEDAILAWCRQYGLLGVLPHETLSVTLAARWDYMGRAAGKPDGWEDDPHQMALQVQYLRAGGVWRQAMRCIISRKEPLRSPPRGSPPEIIPADGTAFDKPKVMLLRMGKGEVEVEGLGAHWARHFPTVTASEVETFLYPCPGTPNFWKLYAEPLDEFVGAVLRLKSALTAVAERGGKGPSPTDAFAPLVGPVGMAVEAGADAVLDTRWIYPTLLASLSGMIVQDRSANRRPRRCQSTPCNNLFVSSAWQAKYCSSRCSKRAEMRAYRNAGVASPRKAKARRVNTAQGKLVRAKPRSRGSTVTGRTSRPSR